MSNGDNGEAAEKSLRPSVYVLTLRLDPITNQFTLEGLAACPFPVALGLLAYAEMMIRREDARVQLAQAAQQVPRIFRPRGGV